MYVQGLFLSGILKLEILKKLEFYIGFFGNPQKPMSNSLKCFNLFTQKDKSIRFEA